MPAVTGHAKTHPQFPVPAATGREKPCQDICLSYPPWRVFGPPIVLLLLRTNKPMTMDFLSIFLGDFRGPRKTVFWSSNHALEKCRQSWRVAGQIYKLPESCFHSLNGQITSLALKMERENIKRCFGGLRMEDQRRRSPQSFLVNNFPSFNHDENKTIDALSSEFWIPIADLKQLSGLKKTKMAMYSISSKLKSAFSIIGKTTADKLNFKTCREKLTLSLSCE